MKYLSLMSLLKVVVTGLIEISVDDPLVRAIFTVASVAGALSTEILIGIEVVPTGMADASWATINSYLLETAATTSTSVFTG